ncbi:MAG: condensation domain-containing protein, partial [Bacteroidota bacterium]
MISFFNKLADNGVFLKVLDGKLKVYAEEKEIDQDLLQEVKVRKEQIISYLLEKDAIINTEITHTRIPLADVSVSYPLSDAQRRLWILSQFTGGSIAYNMPSCVDLYGEYRLDLLRDAIASTLERHEILRTVFKEDESGEVRQWVLSVADLGFVLDYQDFRSSSDPQ